MERQQEVEEFWRKKEADLGEPILERSISHTFMVGLADTFGILYASAGSLVYEYSKGGRRSILDVLLSRKKDDELTETVRIPREEIQTVRILDACSVKRWIRQQLPPWDILAAVQSRPSSALQRLLCGSYLVVCTQRQFAAFDTPTNKQWLAFLSRGASFST
jgi:hypothetical protein